MKLLKLLFPLFLASSTLAAPQSVSFEKYMATQKCGNADAILLEDSNKPCSYKCVEKVNEISHERVVYLADESKCMSSRGLGKCIKNVCVPNELFEFWKNWKVTS